MPEETAVQAQAAPVEAVAAATVTPVVIDNPVAHLDRMAEAAAIGDTATYVELEKQYAASQAKAAEPAAEPVKEPEPEPVVAAEPVVETEVDHEAEPQLGETPVVEKEPNRFRFSKDEDRAVAMIAKTKGISLVEAAKLFSGEPVTKAEPVAAQAHVVDTTITDLETEVAGLETALDEAGASEGLFTPEVAALTKRLTKASAKLESKRESAVILAHQQQAIAQQSETQIKQQWATLETQAVAELPDLANPNSPLSLMRAGLGNAMKDPSHPDHAELFKPSAPTFLARKAAEILKIVPRGTNVPQPPSKPAVTTKEVVRPAPGSRTTAIPAGEPTPQDIIAAENAKTDAMLNGGYVPQKSGVIIL